MTTAPFGPPAALSCCDYTCQITRETSCSWPAEQPLRLHKHTQFTLLCACQSALPAAPLRGRTDGQTLIVQTWGQTLPMLPWQLPLHRPVQLENPDVD